MKQSKNISTEKCYNCGDEYLRRTKKVKGRRYKSNKYRPVNTVTCCRKCSREYSRLGFKERQQLPNKQEKK